MGPTGAGKSALALAIAQSRPAVIINADAMQMVADLRILTARPTVAEEAAAEHALYGVLRAEEPTSVARWLALAESVIRRAWAEGKLPLLVGGTGMYVKALAEGLAAVPPIPPPIREEIRALSTEAIRAALEVCDPAMAAALKPGDTQRNARALEVMRATGTSLADWQGRAAAPLFPEARFHYFAVSHPREEIYRRIDARFLAMMAAGAVEEVRGLYESTNAGMRECANAHVTSLPPIFRAHGVPELAAYLRGEMSREAAITKAQQNTRNYAKRQITWLRNQLPEVAMVQQVAQIVRAL